MCARLQVPNKEGKENVNYFHLVRYELAIIDITQLVDITKHNSRFNMKRDLARNMLARA